MFYQIFFLPLVKRSVIITNKHGVYELPNKFFIYLFIYLFFTYFISVWLDNSSNTK